MISLDTAIHSLNANIARRAIEDAIGAVNRAFDGLTIGNGPAKSAPALPPNFRAGTKLARIGAAMLSDPSASNAEIARRIGMDCDDAFVATASTTRRRLGMPNRRRGSAPKESSLPSRMRIAISANPTATNREIAALVGAPYSHSLATMCWQLRKKLGIAPLRQPAASVPVPVP